MRRDADPVRLRPITPAALVEEVARRCLNTPYPGAALRVAVDGADGARPGSWAERSAVLLRVAGRPTARVSMHDWWRPASVRLEQGRHDPESYRRAWFDHAALQREVLDPCGPGGAGTWLPSLWDAERDRATRAATTALRPGTVLIVDGPMLAGRGLGFDLIVHLHLSAGALRRVTAREAAWTIPAVLAHEDAHDVDDTADLVAHLEHADRPALRPARGR